MDQIDILSGAVFKIITSSGTGTCFHVKDKKVLVTNHHVVDGNRTVTVQDHKLNRYLADVVYINPQDDIAFLRCRSGFSQFPDISVASAKQASAGQQVYVLGFPYGMPFSVTQGIISAPKQMMGNGKHYIQTDAAINPGNSGGPVVTTDGFFLGIASSKFNNADNMGFAIPAEIVANELNNLQFNPENKFSVKCQSCDSLVLENEEYCNNCGAEIDKKLFEEIPLTNIAVFVEDAIKGLGMDPILARAGFEFWEFHQGSSLIRVFVYNRKYLYATSPLNNLPKANLKELYEFLLQDKVSPYQLGVTDNKVFISYRVAVPDLFSSHNQEIKDNLTQLALKADELDDFFVKTFGCEKTSFAKIE